MPLVLSMREGDDVYVGGKRFVLTEIVDENEFYLDDDAGKTHKIVDVMSTEICQDVYASSGGVLYMGVVRLVLDAPRRIAIARGKVLERNKE